MIRMHYITLEENMRKGPQCYILTNKHNGEWQFLRKISKLREYQRVVIRKHVRHVMIKLLIVSVTAKHLWPNQPQLLRMQYYPLENVSFPWQFFCLSPWLLEQGNGPCVLMTRWCQLISVCVFWRWQVHMFRALIGYEGDLWWDTIISVCSVKLCFFSRI